nr:prepilin-type N-terminal cleavage/methylation domain-containing protein [Geobacter hydrogenophilus]
MENQKGFTLVELLVAILLMTVGIFAVIAMQTTSMQANSIAMRLSVATSLAQEALEDILSLPPDDVTLNSAGTFRNSVTRLPYPLHKSTIEGGGTYTATYTTKVGPDGVVPQGITKVIVEVVEVARSGRSVAVTGFKRTN